MDETIFRKKSLDRIASPESLGDYLRVTNPAVWMILAAVILLIVGMLIWSASAQIDSFATGTAQVTNGSVRIVFDDPKTAGNVQIGAKVEIGDTEARVTGVGTDETGAVFAYAVSGLPDGNYPAKVIYRTTQVIRLLFN